MNTVKQSQAIDRARSIETPKGYVNSFNQRRYVLRTRQTLGRRFINWILGDRP